MIRSHPHSTPPWGGARWIDLVQPTEEERAAVEKATGLRIPTENAIREIESSSRVFMENSAAYLSMPLPASADGHATLGSVGFVLNAKLLVTVRFSDHSVFDDVFKGCDVGAELQSGDIFLRLLEALIDRAADALEHASAELDQVSHAAFHAEKVRLDLKRADNALRQGLRKLGRTGDFISQIRDTLLGIGRIAAFVGEGGDAVLNAEGQPRLKAIRADIVSLADYEQHLAGKVQFLLDATLGFISMEQNDIVKTLTIVSVVGVPPVVIAGIYGMNFHYMPELAWPHGYPFALILMLVTGLAPLAWFKWRGWM